MGSFAHGGDQLSIQPPPLLFLESFPKISCQQALISDSALWGESRLAGKENNNEAKKRGGK